MTATNRAERLKQLSPQKRLLLLQALRQQATAKPAPVIPHRAQLSPAPLSLAQQRLWFLDRLAPGNAAYNISAAVRLQGTLNVTALEQSVGEVIRRHEALRTTFATVNGEPVQVIAATLPFKLAVVDLQALPELAQLAAVQQCSIAEAQHSFDLAAGSLLRVTLLQLSETESIALLTLHHIVSDGWSIAVLVREVAALYAAFCNSEQFALPELPLQFADFAVWQRQAQQVAKLDHQLQYWKQQLADAAQLPPLPTDYPRSTPTLRGVQRSFLLPQSLTQALKQLSQQTETTLFMTLLTTFQALLYCYTDHKDILVGTPIANRDPVELEDLIGCFVNTLVLRVSLEGNPSFRELLARSRQVTLAAFAHPDVPFEKLVEELQPQRHLSYNPLFQVWFALHNTPVPCLELPGLSITPLEIESGMTRHDLSLHLWETSSGLQGVWEYKTDLFEPTTCDRLLQQFTAFLNKIVAQPNIPLSELAAMYTHAEQHYQRQHQQDSKEASLKKLKSARRTSSAAN